PHIVLPRQGLEAAVAVAVEVEGAAVHAVPGSEGIVAEDEGAAVEGELGVRGEAGPAMGEVGVAVEIAEEEVLAAVEAGEDGGGLPGTPCEIAQVPDLVALAHGLVP